MEKNIFNYISEYEYGVIHLEYFNRSNIYDKIAENNSVFVSNDKFDTEHFKEKETIFNNIRNVTNIRFQHNKVYLNHNALFSLFLELHNIIFEKSISSEARKKQFEDLNFTFCNVIFLEVNFFISKEIEYIVMLYMYYLNLGIKLPRLYVVFSFYSNGTQFIAEDIMDLKKTPLLKIKSSIDVDLLHYKLNVDDYVQKLYESKFHVIFTTRGKDDDGFFKHIETVNDIEKRFGEKYNNINDYIMSKKSDNVKKASSENILIRVSNFDEIHKIINNVDLIYIDIVILTQISALYIGNMRVEKTMHEDCIISMIKYLIEIGYKKSIFVSTNAKDNVIRENELRDFSTDVLQFAKYKINLSLLYKNYFSREVVTKGRIANAYSMNEKLGFIKAGNMSKYYTLPLELKLHPLITKLILLWFQEEKLPIFPILLFAAVLTTFTKMSKEIKEHGIREVEGDIGTTSRWGESMSEYIKLMKKTGRVVMSEGGKTSEVLKHLLDKTKNLFEKTDSVFEIAPFDLNVFTLKFSQLVKKYFESEILSNTAQGYIKSNNLQIKWHNFAESRHPYNQIFPLIAFISKTSVNIIAYVPIIDNI